MQPYFLPYLGYFQLMKAVDCFVILDDVNYIKGGWINRNRILLNGQPHWITIPLSGASPNRRINEIEIADDSRWKDRARGQFDSAYRQAPYRDEAERLVDAVLKIPDKSLSAFLRESLNIVASLLGLETKVVLASQEFPREELASEERIVHVCKALGASEYINPLGGEDLYDANSFREVGVALHFLQPDLEAYQQGKDPAAAFVPNLSILDVVARAGWAFCRQQLSRHHLRTPA